MRYTYKLTVSDEIEMGKNKITINNIGKASVKWVDKSKDSPARLEISFSGVPLNDGEIFDANSSETTSLAYEIALYLENRMFIETGQSIVDADEVMNKSPVIDVESDEEKKKYSTMKKEEIYGFPSKIEVIKRGEDVPYEVGFEESAAYGYYADSLRVRNPFLKYELLYKVLEYHIDAEGKKFDDELSEFAIVYDEKFTKEYCENIRFMRNKSVHPHARHGHINSENIEDVKTICKYLKDIEIIAKKIIEVYSCTNKEML